MLLAFDLDGTIADTESQVQPDVVSMLNQQFNVPVTLKYWQQNFHGMAGRPLVDAINQHFNTMIIFEDFAAARVQCWPKLVAQGFNPAPGIYQALRQLITQNHLQYCICSNSRPERIIDTLQVLKGQHSAGISMPQVFANRMFSGLVENSPIKPKPAPDIYLAASQHFQITPQNAVAIEDTPVGIQAAKAAGYGTIIGYTGLSHHPKEDAEKLKSTGATHLLTHWDDFIPLLTKINT